MTHPDEPAENQTPIDAVVGQITNRDGFYTCSAICKTYEDLEQITRNLEIEAGLEQNLHRQGRYHAFQYLLWHIMVDDATKQQQLGEYSNADTAKQMQDNSQPDREAILLKTTQEHPELESTTKENFQEVLSYILSILSQQPLALESAISRLQIAFEDQGLAEFPNLKNILSALKILLTDTPLDDNIKAFDNSLTNENWPSIYYTVIQGLFTHLSDPHQADTISWLYRLLHESRPNGSNYPRIFRAGARIQDILTFAPDPVAISTVGASNLEDIGIARSPVKGLSPQAKVIHIATGIEVFIHVIDIATQVLVSTADVIAIRPQEQGKMLVISVDDALASPDEIKAAIHHIISKGIPA